MQCQENILLPAANFAWERWQMHVYIQTWVAKNAIFSRVPFLFTCALQLKQKHLPRGSRMLHHTTPCNNPLEGSARSLAWLKTTTATEIFLILHARGCAILPHSFTHDSLLLLARFSCILVHSLPTLWNKPKAALHECMA
jgi:hypothetical protein